jgi:predicted aminopeptidase
LAAALLAAPGCSLSKLGLGQLALINDQRPLDEAVARERDAERQILLREVPAILAFAEDVVGLHVGQSYRGYFETERRGLTYVVTASERLRFEPYTWWFPIVGKVEYRSDWDEDDAEATARELEAKGYDTWISPSRAYSSLGILRDPITTTMLHDGLPALAELLIHELSHAKLYVPGHTDFNEALASFVGERGAERYFAEARFRDTPLPAQMRERAQRKLAFDAAINAGYSELEALYASQLTAAEKERARQGMFQQLERTLNQIFPSDEPGKWRVNNARLLHFHRYTANNRMLAELWAKSGKNFRHFWLGVERYAKEQL